VLKKTILKRFNNEIFKNCIRPIGIYKGRAINSFVRNGDAFSSRITTQTQKSRQLQKTEKMVSLKLSAI